MGKISAVARGAKKSKSALLSSSQMFAYANFTLKKEGGMYRVTQSEIIKSFYNLSYNFEAFSYATHIIKLIDTMMVENQANSKLFVLLAQSLYLYSEEKTDIEYITKCFELKFLDYIGFRPIVSSCVSCNTKQLNNIYFNVFEGGILCDKCAVDYEHNLRINITTASLMQFILNNDILENYTYKSALRYIINTIQNKYNKANIVIMAPNYIIYNNYGIDKVGR